MKRLDLIYIFISFFIVAFGQPVWSNGLGLIAATVGYAIFFRGILFVSSPRQKWIVSTLWFMAVQLVQFSWFTFHPFSYIYAVWLMLSFLIGIQWGFLSLLVKKPNLFSLWNLLAISGCWTILEWSRLYFFSGLPLNPIGLSLTGNLSVLQIASLTGIYGLSFWVIFTNLFILRLWVFPFNFFSLGKAIFICLIPFLIGNFLLFTHAKKFDYSKTMNIVLIQPGFPVEESLGFQSAEEARQHVLGKWEQIFDLLKKQMGQSIDLIVLPEYVVPYGTFQLFYPENEVKELFKKKFGVLLEGKRIFGDYIITSQGMRYFLSNASIIQNLADFFQADVLIGLEDSEKDKNEVYSSAFLFKSNTRTIPLRYEKRILVPMGEYIPFEWCRQLAAKYGIAGSFQPGKEAKVFPSIVPIGCSICYEELFGHLMTDNRKKGAEMLVNLTNDGWFPGSLLPKQHFDHARLRSVELGIPLIRACNTGISCAVDSLGRIVDCIENEKDSILIKVPKYVYPTLYSKMGDWLILSISGIFIFIALALSKKNNYI